MFDIGTKINTLNRTHYGCQALENLYNLYYNNMRPTKKSL